MRSHLEAVIANDERAIATRLQWLADAKTKESKRWIASSLKVIRKLKSEEETKLAKLEN
jgi:hypothetical protein